jgi:hypothetical protein
MVFMGKVTKPSNPMSRLIKKRGFVTYPTIRGSGKPYDIE